jgi:hypothetical protein
MPYNVIGQHEDRSKIEFCRTAAEARDVAQRWLASGVEGLRVVSVQGITVPPERLALIARVDDEPVRRAAA